MGTVANMSDTMLRIEFYNLPYHFDKWINKKSIELAPAGEYTDQDHDWRKKIFRDGQGILIDCLKGKGVGFVEATILETKYEQLSHNRVYPSVLIGYRIYRKTGYYRDVIGTYDGYGKSHDEWIPLMSHRIAPYKSKTETEAEKKMIN